MFTNFCFSSLIIYIIFKVNKTLKFVLFKGNLLNKDKSALFTLKNKKNTLTFPSTKQLLRFSMKFCIILINDIY